MGKGGVPGGLEETIFFEVFVFGCILVFECFCFGGGEVSPEILLLFGFVVGRCYCFWT